MKNPLKDIFPNGNIRVFEHFLKSNEGDIELSLWCYGAIRKGQYKKEVKALKEYYKRRILKWKNTLKKKW